jgi:hypothetical protein
MKFEWQIIGLAQCQAFQIISLSDNVDAIYKGPFTRSTETVKISCLKQYQMARRYFTLYCKAQRAFQPD